MFSHQRIKATKQTAFPKTGEIGEYGESQFIGYVSAEVEQSRVTSNNAGRKINRN